MTTNDSRWVTAHFAGFYLEWIGASPVPNVNLIRQWAHRGKIRRAGTDPSGYALYSLADIVDYARSRGHLEAASRAARHDPGAC